MKTTSLILSFLLLVSISFAQNKKTVSSDPGFAANYHDLQLAINTEPAGTILYVHPGSYGSITLNKQMIIYGPGYFLGANPETQANLNTTEIATLTISPAAANSYLTGLHFKTCYLQANDVWLRGNFMDSLADNGLYNVQGLNFVGNYVRYSVRFNEGSHISNSFFENNYFGGEILVGVWTSPVPNPNLCPGVIYEEVSTNLHNCTFKNNVFGFWICGSSNNTFINNIFSGADVYPPFLDYQYLSCFWGAKTHDNIIVNNVFVGDSIFVVGSYPIVGAAIVSINNQFFVPINNIFGSNYPNGDASFTLATNSPAKAANNGTNPPVDYGIFGGTLANRYKLSGLWDNPAIYEIIMPSSGTNTGGLNVTVKAKVH